VPVPTPEDDRAHTPNDEPRWRESYYFSFFDFKHQIGGFSSIGKRPIKGYSGSINAIWGPNIPTYVASERGRFETHADEFAVAGLRYVKQEALGPWRVQFDGRMNHGGTGRACDLEAVTQAEQFEGPSVAVSYDLQFTPSAAYLYNERPEWNGLFDGHVDELGAMKGTLVIDGETFKIDARGSKDHSWGARDWSKPQAWRWVDVLFDEGPEVALWRATFDGSTWIDDGAIFDGPVASGVQRFEETLVTELIGDMQRPKDHKFSIVSADARLGADGDVVRIIPLTFGDGNGRIMWNDRSLVRCATHDGRVGWAGVEFQSQVAEEA
jgi:hypothetical protein